MKRDEIPFTPERSLDEPFLPDAEQVSEEQLRDELHEFLTSSTETPAEVLMLHPAPGMQKSAVTLNFEQDFRQTLARAIDVKDGPSHEELGRLIAERSLWAWEECR